jgi:hypothetical protein
VTLFYSRQGIQLTSYRHSTLQHLMAYIVDLTLVMQNVFWLADGRGKISRRLIKVALKAYLDSEVKGDAHFMISEHVKKVNVASPGARDTTLEKITEILEKHRIQSEDMFKQKSQIGGFDISAPDEPWDPR